MGLDSYVYAIDPKFVVDDTTPYSGDINNVPEHLKEVQYWRKNHSVHKWMKELYYRKTNLKDDFNLTYIRVTKENLEELKRYLFLNKIMNEDPEVDYDHFFRHCDYYLDTGRYLYYYSWW
jgi:hypothetical protein